MIEGYLVVKIEGLEVDVVCDEILWDRGVAEEMAKSVCKGKFGQVLKVQIRGVTPAVRAGLVRMLGK